MTTDKSRADAPTKIAQFLTDVVTAAGLLSYGRTDKKLATRISVQAYELRKHIYLLAAPPVEPPAAAPVSSDREFRATAAQLVRDMMTDLSRTIEERDRAEEVGARLANTVGEFLGVDVGEWSSANDPILAAIEALETRSPAMAAAAPADERATWSNARDSLAVAMAGFAGRSSNRDFNAAIGVLDAITEPGLPLAWLRTARAAASPIASIPAGYALVPIEPTDAMIESGAAAGVPDGEGLYYPFSADEIGIAYCAMIAARPHAPQPAQADAPATERATIPEPTDDVLCACGWETWNSLGSYVDRGTATARYRSVATYVLEHAGGNNA
ncbi:hypothetical protein [Burkholderia cepacia]|uniref:hypothetical protein n=1 Tax=Burkholderia cepacia TaxID=292 RepID=UPI000755CD92|nr:hypothetical protein [Burkholderia cepacia]KVS62698.1 hypothetical protein WK41_31960 [Burkholderia cepacia]